MRLLRFTNSEWMGTSPFPSHCRFERDQLGGRARELHFGGLALELGEMCWVTSWHVACLCNGILRLSSTFIIGLSIRSTLFWVLGWERVMLGLPCVIFNPLTSPCLCVCQILDATALRHPAAPLQAPRSSGRRTS